MTIFDQHCQDTLRRLMQADSKKAHRPDPNAWGHRPKSKMVKKYRDTPIKLDVLECLRTGELSAHEIATMTGYTRARCYMALRIMVHYGKVSRITVNPCNVRYAIVEVTP